MGMEALLQTRLSLVRESSLEARFGRFDASNPHVWALFVRFTLEVVRAGHRHYGAAAIFERIRWHMEIETSDPEFKLNNDYRAYYARKFMRQHPEHEGFFRVRRVRGEERWS